MKVLHCVSSMALDSLVDHLHLPLSTEAHSELHQLQDIFEGLHESDINDKWSAFGSIYICLLQSLSMLKWLEILL
jgi:hypothetical protein